MEGKLRTCKYCGTSFSDMLGKVFANHVRWCNKNITNGDKGSSNIKAAKKTQHDSKLGSIEQFDKICENPKCCKPFQVMCRSSQVNKASRYCSVRCRNLIGAHSHREWTENMKLDASNRTKELWSLTSYSEKVFVNNGNRIFTSKGEIEVREHFKHKFPGDGWTYGGSLKMDEHRLVRDLFSKQLKICIEYDGIWHFKDIKGQLARKQAKDYALERWCRINGWRLIRIDENIYNKNKGIALALLEQLVYSSNIPVIKLGERYKTVGDNQKI